MDRCGRMKGRRIGGAKCGRGQKLCGINFDENTFHLFVGGLISELGFRVVSPLPTCWLLSKGIRLQLR